MTFQFVIEDSLVDLFSNLMEFSRFYKIVIPNFQVSLIYVTLVSDYNKTCIATMNVSPLSSSHLNLQNYTFSYI